MRSFTLRGDGCSDGGSGSVVHCLELKHVRVYPVLVHVGARDLVVCSARSCRNIFCWMNREKNWEKNLVPYFDQLVFTRNSTVSICQTYSNAFPHQAAHILKTFSNLQGPGDDCLKDPDFIYSLFKLDCRIIPGNTWEIGTNITLILSYMGTGGGWGLPPSWRPRSESPSLPGSYEVPSPPVREKIFQGCIQNPLKMAEKSFKMSKISWPQKSSIFEPFLTTFQALSQPFPPPGAQSSPPPLRAKIYVPPCQPNSYPPPAANHRAQVCILFFCFFLRGKKDSYTHLWKDTFASLWKTLSKFL